MTRRSDELLAFWLDAGPGRWFRKDAAFDAEFRRRFEDVHEAAARGQLDDWLHEADRALALVIALDQFPRNAFRDSPRMFATDAQAVRAAASAVDQHFDTQVQAALRAFFYMPFMHSEHIADQARCVALCGLLDADTLKFAQLHHDIIARFGRFPHRNRLLGRSTTPAEQAFLDEGGFAG
jgi:uncharacterized protein (DUF924 family)